MLQENRLLLLVLLSCCSLGAALGTIEFIAYGASSGDLQLTPDSAISSAELSLDMPVIYYGRTFNSVFVNSKGYISFESDQVLEFDQDLSQVDSPVIAPFLADIDTGSTGTVYYRMSNNVTELGIVGGLIRRYFFDTGRFSPSSLVIVTWDRVGPYDRGIDQNTFQVVLASDGESSYALFLYDVIQWSQADFRDGMTGSGSSGSGSGGSGIGSGNGLNSRDSRTFAQAGLVNGSNSYIFSGSRTANITALNSTSNIGCPGAWLFRVSDFLPASLCSNGEVRLNIGPDYDYIYGLLEYDDFYYSAENQLTRGIVEVCISQEWGTVCEDQWDDKDASVICAQLQFSPYGAIAVEGSEFSGTGKPVVIGAVNCSGMETSLPDCPFETLPGTCTGGVAGIVCQVLSTLAGSCTDGEVRLQGGSNDTIGRAEVCINNAWGTVCNSRFGTNDAEVICQQLGFSNRARAYRSTAMFGQASGPIFLENLGCSGAESAIFDCPQSVLGLHQCDHSQDAGVQCYDVDQCLTDNGGCDQICINQVPGHVCSCARGYDLHSNGTSCLDILNCTDGDVRLVNGSHSMEGRVEVCYNNTYYTVCDDFWDELEAQVVCRQLGFFTPPDVVPVKGAFFGQGSGSILLDDLTCTGVEQTLLNCANGSNRPLLSSDCDHSEDAGVKCQAECMDGDVRLVVSDEAEIFYMGLADYNPSYYDKDGLRVGRVEVCVGGSYGSICHDSWDDRDASVVCRQLGFSPYGAIAVDADSFSEGNEERLVTNLGCSGVETNILDCSHFTTDGFICVASGAVCQPATTPNGLCITGEARLELSSADIAASTLDGRLELCINNAWGTVCDSLFDGNDAAVACSQVSGFARQGAQVLSRGTIANGIGPIFLSDLHCNGNEISLLDCMREDSQPTGLQSCDHQQDVAIRCRDVDECNVGSSTCEQVCINTIGSFNCSCMAGFSLNSDMVHCDDDDECEMPDTCDPNATCTNTNGSFLCECNAGYTRNGSACSNINECELSVCDAAAVCVDTDGGYECTCAAGYSGNGLNCSDIDECQRGSDMCNTTVSECFNTVGSFECICRDGFNMTNQECVSINECDFPEMNDCHQNANCTNTFASFVCMCFPGYSGNGTDCSNINECVDDMLNTCDVSATCTDADGSFQCLCDNGYSGDGFSCTDINECTGVPCGNNSICNNTNGSFVCTCDFGFAGDGLICADINECLVDTSCINAECFDEFGGFSCGPCYPGFERDDPSNNLTACLCEDGGVRLTNNGSVQTMGSGRVEVCFNNSYGLVCDDRWDEVDAAVVCRQLGMGTTNVVAIRNGALFGESDGTIFLDDVVCSGGERSLLECPHNGIGQHDCMLSETAGVVCGGSCLEGDVRITALAGYDRFQEFVYGEVQICLSGVFGSVCDTSWDNQDASVVCRQMGFSPLGAIGGAGGAETFDTILTSVGCLGNESAILDCPATNSTDCVSQEIATVICQDVELTAADCDDGDVRLVNGNNSLEGRVEVCFNDIWGTVCNERFDSDDAQVICNQLALPFEESVVLTGDDSFGPGNSSPLFIETISCDGNEMSILECRELNMRRQSCTHARDVSIRCTDIDECALNIDNCSHCCVNDLPYYHCDCPSGGQLDPTNLTCVFNANCTVSDGGEVSCQCLPGHRDVSSDQSLNCTDVDECADLTVLCLPNFQCVNTEGSYTCVCNNGFFLSSDNSTCFCNDGDLRLVNGSTPMEGRLEVCRNNTFGTVCDDQWDVLDARVACRELNFASDDAVPLRQAYFGQGTGDIFLDELQCEGTELALRDCGSDSSHNCNHEEDAGLRCQSACTDGRVRLLVGMDYEYYLGETMLSDHYYGKDELLRGRVEVCLGGRYGTVCNDFWDNVDASVVCRQLGHSPYGAIALTDSVFSEERAVLALRDVDCNGSEPNLLSCVHNRLSQTNCGPLEDAGVVCQPDSTVAGDCEDGQVRLVEGMVDEQMLTLDGRLEICFNNAWGTVCNTFFRTIDAQVACDQLTGFSREGAQSVLPMSIAPDGPIFLDELFCTASDRTLQECNRGIRAVGLTSCNHTDDVWVQCSDVNECETDNGGCEQVCTNSVGSYNCSCLVGFSLEDNSFNCTNVNECSKGTHNCDGNATCNDTIGSFFCVCNMGYSGSSGVLGNCTDMDECTADSPPCHANATCTNLIGSFECACNSGFSGEGRNDCSDVDECSVSNGGCGQACMNTIGSFFCECGLGYILVNETECSDIDECQSNQSLCSQNATCVNLPGSYMCICNLGFTGDGADACTDINECDLTIDNCDANALCENLVGNFSCVCDFGYTGSGSECSCTDGQVRLMNGSAPSNALEGRVEICLSNTYGTVCDDLWNNEAARVACGGRNGAPLKGIDSVYGSGNGSIILDNVVCNGDEDNLFLCAHNDFFDSNCDHTEDVAVVCNVTCLTGAVRLANDAVNLVSRQPVQDFIKDEVARGRVEVCVNNAFGTVCDVAWDDADASVACRQLGFSAYGAIAVGRQFYGVSPLTNVVPNVTCAGNETELLQCDSTPLSCPTQQTGAGVVCYATSTEEGNCSDGDIRLVNGTTVTPLEGRVEVCINNAWGTVCDRTFSEDEANVICRQTGYRYNGTVAFRGAFYGEGTGPIFLERYDCNEDDARFLDCAERPIGVHTCDHSNDAGVKCIDFNECTIDNGGCEQMCVNQVAARVQCLCFGGFTLDSNGINCTDINECSSDPCHLNATCVNTEGSFVCSCSGNFEGDGMNCSLRCENGFQLPRHEATECVCLDGDLRIGNDSSLMEGGVEICINNSYGGICDDFWDIQDARVTCRLLGFDNTDSQPLLGLGTSRLFVLDNVQCNGNEDSLLDCSINPLGEHNCDQFSGAGVRCQASCGDGDIRICLGTDRNCVVSASAQYLIDDRLSVGRVEVCSSGRYGTVCDDVWTDEAASVACRQLGFSPYGAIALTNTQFAEGINRVSITSQNCVGTEDSLASCSDLGGASGSCGRFEDAGIVCQEQNTLRSNCSTGTVRLADPHEQENTVQGRVEVCINQAWGTVCNDTFNQEDAGTVCVAAGGYLRNASLVVETQMFGQNSPIFLEQLDCTSLDEDLLECNSFSTTGIHNCTHLQDISVMCTDIDECLSQPCEQECMNNIGSFECDCRTGYLIQSDGRNCSDIDECAIESPEEPRHNCHSNATCANTEGSFICRCNGGYRGNGTMCTNINECAEELDDCHRESNSTCTDTDGSFTCTCRDGFDGNGTFCTDIDECLDTTVCDTNAECNNTYGSFVCMCETGYMGDGFTCVDVNECNISADNCDPENGACANTEGSFICTCNIGYTGDGINCTNIDECREDMDNCDDENANCMDTVGSFLCMCNVGFSGDGVSCDDIDECREVRTNNCHRNANCTNTIGNFSCMCNFGFTGNGVSCDDVDECLLGQDNCDDERERASCGNTFGSFSCECDLGYSGDGTIGNCNCMNGDVLLMNGSEPTTSQREGRVEICYDDEYHSICDDLWDEKGAQVVCRQLNISGNTHFPIRGEANNYGRGSGEILLDNIVCDGSETSLLECDHNPLMETNCAGDHSEDAAVACGVACKNGYVQLVDNDLDIFLIKDALSRGRVEICISETFQTICEDSWTNDDASVLCSELGFARHGAIGLGNALFSSNNILSPGKSLVMCNGNENRLADCSAEKVSGIQCETASAICQDRNTTYEPCEDGDVRLRDGTNHLDGRLEICINDAWGTVCENEFTSDEARIVCAKLGFNEGVLEGMPEAVSGGTFGVGVGPIFLDQLRCRVGDTSLLGCPSGVPHGLVTCTHSQDVGVTCPDRNECKETPFPCHANANCTNNVGSFSCNCTAGFVGDGFSSCTDIDECLENPCQDVCTNTPGSFTCSCTMSGYRVGDDSVTCVDIDECAMMTHNCTDMLECVNTNGSFSCDCRSGYMRNSILGDGCYNFNECTVWGMPCGSNATCMDTEGSFDCTCDLGYERSEASNCTDTNECLGANSSMLCGEFADCVNAAGSYACVCQIGYTGNGTQGICIDVDECVEPSLNNCSDRAKCRNLEGGYECQCSPGYIGNGFSCDCNNGDTRLISSNGTSAVITAINSLSHQAETCIVTMENSVIVDISNCSARGSNISSARGSNIIEGRVEVCEGNAFHSVCDDRWDLFEARVVCTQLNSATIGAQPVLRSSMFYGEGTGDIRLSELDCNGTERNLLECPPARQQGSDVRMCSHFEDAGVRCDVECEDYAARIIIGDDIAFYSDEYPQEEDYYIEGNLATGRIELCMSGVWRPVCQDFWTEADASVACYQMGYSRYGALVGNQKFTDSEAMALIHQNLNCDSTENHLSDCIGPLLPADASLESGCVDVLRSAYIVCQERGIEEGNCSNGQVRLESGSLGLVRDGRVEVCVNRVWGTVCSEQFSEDDAQVVCSQMNFERSGSMLLNDTVRQRFSGLDNNLPIFLSTLDCGSNDRAIINCSKNDPLGLTNCNHNQDVFVHCDALCEAERVSSSHGVYSWPVTAAEDSMSISCQYGAAFPSETLILAVARRYCDPRGEWMESNVSECASFTDSTIRNISNLPLATGLPGITQGIYDSVVQATDSEDQSEVNINEIARTYRRVATNCSASIGCFLGFEQVLNLTNALESLQSWRQDIRELESAEIAITMEGIVADYIEETGIPSNQINVTETFTSINKSITFSGFKELSEELKMRGVMYSVRQPSDVTPNIDVEIREFMGESFNASDLPEDTVSILIPPDAFINQTSADTSIVFSAFNTSDAYPLFDQAIPQFGVASSVVSATVVGSENNIFSDITVVLRLTVKDSQLPVCVFWDASAAGGRGNWSDGGCRQVDRSGNIVICRCDHLSSFGVLVNTDPIQCDNASLPNPSVTRCIAQKPGVNITAQNGRVAAGNITEYVKVGRSFEVSCDSTGNYKGRITWMKKSGTSYVAVPEVPFQRNENASGFSQVSMEQSGQLYAYRVNSSSVYLGTRNAGEFGAAIGVGVIANGSYMCIAQNRNESASVNLAVTVEAPIVSPSSYIRFSTPSFVSIRENLNLMSDALVTGVIETTVFETINQDGTHHVVKCDAVSMRPEDTDNNWSRVACDISISTVERIMSLEGQIRGSLTRDNLLVQEEINISPGGFCDYEIFEPDNRGRYNWTESEVTSRLQQGCQYGNRDAQAADGTGMVRRECIANLMWGNYDGSTCATLDTLILRMISSAPVTAEMAAEVISQVADVVNNLDEGDEQTPDNAELIANVFGQIGNLVEGGQLNVTTTFVGNTASVVSDISSWPEDSLAEQSSGIVQSFETITFNLALSADNFSLSEEQISVISERIEVMDFEDDLIPFTPAEFANAINFTGNATDVNITIIDSRIEISPNAFPDDVDSSYVLNLYATPILFPVLVPETVNQSTFDVIADSQVIGFTIPQEDNVTNTTVRITLQSLKGRQGIEVYNPICVSWEFNSLIDGNTSRGNWTEKGCKFVGVDKDTKTYTCVCDHLTNFAVLVNTNAPISKEVAIALEILTIIGATLSIAGLSLTIFTMIFFKKLRSRDASNFHVQLCIAMLLMLLIFVVGIKRTEKVIVCTAVSTLIQYFTLASALWMGAEAILMFKKLIIVFGRITRSFIVTISLICWGVPLILPAIGLTTLATGENYLISSPSEDFEEGYCFISDNRIRYGIFLAPLLAVIIFNLVIFVLVGRVLLKHSKRSIDRAKEDKDPKKVVTGTLKTLISIVSVMLMFGLSWLFGALSVSQAAIVFQWLFVIFNTSQGFWLFVFFCVIGNDAREEWKKLLSCYRYKGAKKGTTASSGSKPRITKETSLTSRRIASTTIRRSVGLLEKYDSVDMDSSVAPMEMSEISPTKTNFIDSIIEEDTSLIIANGLSELGYNDKPKSSDSQVPPQVLFRLKRSYYDLMVEPNESTLGTSPDCLHSEIEIIDAFDDHHSFEGSECSSTAELTEL